MLLTITSGANAAVILLERGRAYEQLGKSYLALRDYGRALEMAPADSEILRAHWQLRARVAPAAQFALVAENVHIVEGSEPSWLMLAEYPWLDYDTAQLLEPSDWSNTVRQLFDSFMQNRAPSGQVFLLHIDDLIEWGRRQAGFEIPTRFDAYVVDARLQELPDFMGEATQGDTAGVLRSIGDQLFHDFIRSSHPEVNQAQMRIDPQLLITGVHPARRIYFDVELPSTDPWAFGQKQVTAHYAFHLIALPPDRAHIFVLKAGAKAFDQRLEEVERMLDTLVYGP